MSTDGGILLPSSDAEDRTLTVAKDTVQKTFKCNLPVPPALTHGKKTTQRKNQTFEWRKLTPFKEAQTCNPLTPSMTMLGRDGYWSDKCDGSRLISKVSGNKGNVALLQPSCTFPG